MLYDISSLFQPDYHIYNLDVKHAIVIDTFNNILVISWGSVLLEEETGVPKENHRPVESHRQTLSHNVVLWHLVRVMVPVLCCHLSVWYKHVAH
jgi:hypothetical protein